MRDRSDGERRRGGRALRWAEYLLIAAGVAMFAWAALLVTLASLSQASARRALEMAARAYIDAPRAAPEAATSVPGPAPRVLRGSAIADLSIPRIDLAAVVLHGSDARTLRRGPGHLEGSALPGEAGNVVVAGHRDSFFAPLREIQMGDDIFIHTPAARFHYRVTSLRVVDPHDLSVLEPTDDETLTLITCYPFWVLGHAPDRFIVRAERVSNDAPAAFAARPPPPHESTAAPIEAPAAFDAALASAPIISDDTSLVRLAIERFRLTYNARLVSHDDIRPSGPLKFESCEVAIADDGATARCSIPSPWADGEPDVWIAALVRADGHWKITSIVANELTRAAR